MLVWVTLRQKTRVQCGIILLVIGLFALRIGSADIAGVESFTVRLLALFFLLAGGFLSISAYGLMRRAPWGPSSALIACMLGATIGLILTAIQYLGFAHNYHILLWLAILLGPCYLQES